VSALNIVLVIVQLALSVLLVVLILLHSGKDGGMGSVSGFSFAAQASVMEKNLTRYTVIVGVLFFVSSLVLGWRLS
jgi:preprotein translocase subunit SecG